MSQQSEEGMNVQHTPGPWFVSDTICIGPTVVHDQGGCFEILDDPDRNLANVLCTRNPWGDKADEMRANARLIAAAPELLAALQAAHFNEGGYHTWKEQAAAAIAKATGSAS